MSRRKQIISISLIILIIISGFYVITNLPKKIMPWDIDAGVDASMAGGDGTITNPYQISNVDQLQEMNNNTTAHYELINDIDASQTKMWNFGDGFVPIGFDNNTDQGWFQGDPFSGSLNGNGFSINNIYINRINDDFIGLFGYCNTDFQISNLTLINCTIKGNDYIGGLVGYGDVDIINCYAQCNIFGNDNVGGLSGLNMGIIVNCSTNVDIIGNEKVGGLVGRFRTEGILIDNCSSTGSIEADAIIGGLVGENSGKISHSFASTHLIGNGSIGGFVSLNRENIEECYTICNITSKSDSSGGFIDVHEFGEVTNCYSIVSIIGNSSGGFIKTNKGIVNKCYTSGKIIGSSNSGFCWNNNFGGSIRYCYWDEEKFGITSSSGGLGKNTSNMVKRSTFNTWDFTIVWTIIENQSYPHFGDVNNHTIIIEKNSLTMIQEDDHYYYDHKTNDYNPVDVFPNWMQFSAATWLTMDNQTGELYGTPTNDDVGSWPIKIRADDGRGNHDWLNFTINVENVNDDPVILTEEITEVFEDSHYIVLYEFLDVDPTDDAISSGMMSNAKWLSYDKNQLILEGTPTNGDIGQYWINISINDDKGGVDWRNFTIDVINVNDPPLIITSSLPDAIEDEDFYYKFNATDQDPTNDRILWAIVDTNAPFISISKYSGILTGQPLNDHVGDYWILINISDGNEGYDEINYTFSVLNINDPPIIHTTIKSDAQEEMEYFFNFNASDVDNEPNEFIWTFLSNASFLFIEEETGILTGIPDDIDIGDWWVNISVIDGSGGKDWLNFTLTVSNTNDDPNVDVGIIYFSMGEDSVGVSFYLYDYFRDADGDALSFYNQRSNNFTISVTNGVVELIPSSDWQGTEILEFYASDGVSTVSMNVSIEVTSVNDAPSDVQITSDSIYYEGRDQWVNSMASDVDIPFGDTLTFRWHSNVTGEIGIGQSINLSLQVGHHLITLNVTDEEGLSCEAMIEIQIVPLNSSKPGDDEHNNGGFPLLLVILFSIIIVSIICVCVVTFIIKRRKSDKNEGEIYE